ncbi:hypothetical protein DNTS_006406 [Danionella cerebrum]|uniref:Myozenin-2 n=1 Tax=Danionella cerebrum TaxID=2873325 RepID=A0A553RCT0_9TELE|nr:hypothetical protein DNTS_006406 [Danionella translucida]
MAKMVGLKSQFERDRILLPLPPLVSVAVLSVAAGQVTGLVEGGVVTARSHLQQSGADPLTGEYPLLSLISQNISTGAGITWWRECSVVICVCAPLLQVKNRDKDNRLDHLPREQALSPARSKAGILIECSMSQFSTLSERERKMQAAALCHEVHSGANGVTMDLGKKLSTPKDIMLEELSLLSNRGSLNAENSVPSKTPPNTPDTRNPANPEDIAPGYGGPLSNIPPERFNVTAMPKSYHSPWEEAIINDPMLAETLKVQMPAPQARAELPDYKSFNRVATPFGGFEKSPRGITFKLPEVELNAPSFPELQDPTVKRPTFNRTAQGWISDGMPLILPTVSLEPFEIPESDDL